METFNIIKKTFLINIKEFNYLFLFFIFAGIVSVFFELVGLSFFAIIVEKLINKDTVTNLPFFNSHIKIGHFDYKFLIIISFIFFSLRFISIIFLGLFQKKYIYKLRNKLSTVAIKNYFNSNFLKNKQLNSSEMIRNTTHEVDQFSLSLTNSLMTFTLDIIMILLISILLISVNTKITIYVLLFLIFLIAVYVGIFKKKILQLGKNRFAFEANRISFIQKIFYSYREINLQNVSNNFITEFNNLNKQNSKDLILNEMINFIFRPILEFLIIFTVLFSLFFLSPYLSNINNISIILVLSVISLARILPSITRILQSINNFKFFRPTVSSINYYYKKIKEETKDRYKNIDNFKHKISFEDINFYYLNSQKILDNFSFEIFFNKKTAVIGTSGSGKTTIANIVSGFINPNSGTIRIDDREIESLNNIQWKKNIGYLSQDYYLLNSNIYENIAFPNKYQEKHKDKIDKIINSLNLQSIFTDDIRRSDYNIGENGNSLSGGQRQRVAIARIIFQNPQIIILDEFTAGLDNKNEIEVTNLIFDLFKDKTILIITHNKDIFKMVDQIIDLSKDDY